MLLMLVLPSVAFRFGRRAGPTVPDAWLRIDNVLRRHAQEEEQEEEEEAEEAEEEEEEEEE